jgi:hypothetical protein
MGCVVSQQRSAWITREQLESLATSQSNFEGCASIEQDGPQNDRSEELPVISQIESKLHLRSRVAGRPNGESGIQGALQLALEGSLYRWQAQTHISQRTALLIEYRAQTEESQPPSRNDNEADEQRHAQPEAHSNISREPQR